MPTVGQAVAAAMAHQGHPYVWGGWDCSGFINHVLGQQLGLAIPGYKAGQYAGPPPHGPVVSDWLTTDLCVTVPAPKPGDLCIWGPDSHIGMYVGGGDFISALNPSKGTLKLHLTQSDAPGVLSFRRVKALGLSGIIPAMPRAQRAGAAGSVALRLLLLGGAGAGAVLAVAAGVALLSTGAGAAGAGLLARRRTRADY